MKTRGYFAANFDFLLTGMVIILNIIGIFAIGSASAARQTRQIQGMLIGLVVMLVVSFIDYREILRFYWMMYFGNLILLASVLVAGSTGGGAQRWIQIGGITFQPSEAAKILLILFFSKFIMEYRSKIRGTVFLALCLFLVSIPLVLIYRQPDLSTTMMTFLIFAAIVFTGGVVSYRLIAAVLAISVPSVTAFIILAVREGSTLLQDYQRDRILAWLHPEDYETTKSYQTIYSIMAIGSGMLTGKGYNTNEFSSVLNSGYVSQSQTDFIFTVIGEEFGFIGAGSVILLIAFIAVRILMIARDAKDEAGMMIAAGMGCWIGLQGYMNIGVATGVLPNTGIPLPFVSYGLTSLVSLYMGLGFVLNVRMQAKKRAST